MRMRFVAQVGRVEPIRITMEVYPLHRIHCLICWCGSGCGSAEKAKILLVISSTVDGCQLRTKPGNILRYGIPYDPHINTGIAMHNAIP